MLPPRPQPVCGDPCSPCCLLSPYLWSNHYAALIAEVFAPPGRRKALDRVAEHRAWHPRHVFAQECLQLGAIAFSHFAQHPAGSFMDEVVCIVKERSGERECLIEFAQSDEMLRGDDGDTTFPDAFRFCQTIERRPAAAREKSADDLWR